MTTARHEMRAAVGQWERRATPNASESRCTYAESTISGRTQICRNEAGIPQALVAMGWEILSLDGHTAHMLMPPQLETDWSIRE